MKPLRSLVIAAALVGSGCLHADETASAEAGDLDESVANLPVRELTPKLLYRFLLAEIAGQRGQLGVAAEMYFELAKETRDPRVVRRATELLLHSKRLESALQAVRIWLEIEPKSNRARQVYISLLSAQGHFTELNAIVSAMLAAEPNRINQNLLHLNRLFARTPDRKSVREAVDSLTAPYLQHAEAHYARALAAYEMRDMAAARSAIQQALARKSDWETAALFNAQILENRSESLSFLAAFLAANPQAGEARLAYARALVGEKQYVEARREFTRLLALGASDPAKNGDAVFAVAVLSLQLGDTEEAEKYLRQLVDIGHAEIDKARFYLGQIAEEGKRWEEASKWFAQVGRGEHYLPARLRVANVLAKQSRIDDARQLLVSSEASNQQERVQLIIGESQILREAGLIAEAHATLVRGLIRLPDQPELLYETALMAEKLGRSNELEGHLRRLIELRPDHAHAHNALGYSLAERNIRLDEAKRLIERALELSPKDPFILDSKGWLLYRQGETQAAFETLKTAFGIRADPEIAAHLGEVLWVLGRQSEARETWEGARRENPANEVLIDTIKRFLP